MALKIGRSVSEKVSAALSCNKGPFWMMPQKRKLEGEEGVLGKMRRMNRAIELLEGYKGEKWADALKELVHFEIPDSGCGLDNSWEELSLGIVPRLISALAAQNHYGQAKESVSLENTVIQTPKRLKQTPFIQISKVSFSNPRCTGEIEIYKNESVLQLSSISAKRSWIDQIPLSNVKHVLLLPVDEKKLYQLVFIFSNPISPAFNGKKSMSEVVATFKYSDSCFVSVNGKHDSDIDENDLFEMISELVPHSESVSSDDAIPCVFKVNQGCIYLLDCGMVFTPAPFTFVPKKDCSSFRMGEITGRYFEFDLKTASGNISFGMIPKSHSLALEGYFADTEDKENSHKQEKIMSDELSENDEDFEPEVEESSECDYTTTDDEEEGEGDESEEDGEASQDEDDELGTDAESEDNISDNVDHVDSNPKQSNSFFAVTDSASEDHEAPGSSALHEDSPDESDFDSDETE